MSPLSRISHDKFLLALAVAAMMLSGGWTWRRQAEIRRLRAQPVTVSLAGSQYEPASVRLPEARQIVWAEPMTQSNGPGWLYEVFTPPVIYYNTLGGSFTVTPPHSPVERITPSGLELIGVKLAPYRLQLMGYFGGPGDYLAAFASTDLPGTMLAREGHRFEDLGLTLKHFSVEKIAVNRSDAGPVYDVAAVAVLNDERTGADVVLDTRTRKLTDTRLAVFQLQAGDDQTSELREGDTFSAEDSTYRIERIQLDPPEVVVRQQSESARLETRIFRPAAGKSVKPNPFPLPAAPGLATNDK